MKTINDNLFGKIFILAFLVVIVGAFMKINHMDGAEILMIISFVVSLGYIVIGIYEVNSSNKIKQSEKVMWIFGFVFISLVAGLVYLLNGRKRVV